MPLTFIYNSSARHASETFGVIFSKYDSIKPTHFFIHLYIAEHIKLAIVAANNHYAGFGPGTVNMFRYMLGLPEAKWEEKEDEERQEQQPASDVKQRTLSDFLS